MASTLREQALELALIQDPSLKADTTRKLELSDIAGAHAMLQAPPGIPGRPARPELIHPAKVPRRSPFKPEGLAALLHAIAHIEFNAIKKARHSNSSHIAQRGDSAS